MLGFDIYTKNSIPAWHIDHALADDMTKCIISYDNTLERLYI